jgi:hypothetical protein
MRGARAVDFTSREDRIARFAGNHAAGKGESGAYRQLRTSTNLPAIAAAAAIAGDTRWVRPL